MKKTKKRVRFPDDHSASSQVERAPLGQLPSNIPVSSENKESSDLSPSSRLADTKKTRVAPEHSNEENSAKKTEEAYEFTLLDVDGLLYDINRQTIILEKLKQRFGKSLASAKKYASPDPQKYQTLIKKLAEFALKFFHKFSDRYCLTKIIPLYTDLECIDTDPMAIHNHYKAQVMFLMSSNLEPEESVLVQHCLESIIKNYKKRLENFKIFNLKEKFEFIDLQLFVDINAFSNEFSEIISEFIFEYIKYLNFSKSGEENLIIILLNTIFNFFCKNDQEKEKIINNLLDFFREKSITEAKIYDFLKLSSQYFRHTGAYGLSEYILQLVKIPGVEKNIDSVVLSLYNLNPTIEEEFLNLELKLNFLLKKFPKEKIGLIINILLDLWIIWGNKYEKYLADICLNTIISKLIQKNPGLEIFLLNNPENLPKIDLNEVKIQSDIQPKKRFNFYLDFDETLAATNFTDPRMQYLKNAAYNDRNSDKIESIDPYLPFLTGFSSLRWQAFLYLIKVGLEKKGYCVSFAILSYRGEDSREFIEKFLKYVQLAQYFTRIFLTDLQPKSNVILTDIQRDHVEISDTLLIDDNCHVMADAKANGIPFVFIPTHLASPSYDKVTHEDVCMIYMIFTLQKLKIVPKNIHEANKDFFPFIRIITAASGQQDSELRPIIQYIRKRALTYQVCTSEQMVPDNTADNAAETKSEVLQTNGVRLMPAPSQSTSPTPFNPPTYSSP